MNEIEQHIREKEQQNRLRYSTFVDPDIVAARLRGVDSNGLPDCLDLTFRTTTGEVVEISFTRSCIQAMGAALNLILTNDEEECTISTT